MSLLSVGEKVHVITRRLFEDDVRRHFAGEVRAVSEHGTIRVEGYAFVFHAGTNEFRKRADKRTRIFSLSDAGIVLNVIPKSVDLEALQYRFVNQRLVVTDGSYTLDINEFGPSA